MHNSRLFALVGVGIGAIGLFLKSLRTAGEGLLPTLSQTSGGFPDGIPRSGVAWPRGRRYCSYCSLLQSWCFHFGPATMTPSRGRRRSSWL